MRLLFQAHQCPGSSAIFSNPGKKNCGRMDELCSFGVSCLGSTCLNFQVDGLAGLSRQFPFGLELVALGLVIDLSGVSRELVRLGNTEKRKLEIMAELDAVMGRQLVTSTEWMSLRGRLQYFESQLCGRRSVLVPLQSMLEARLQGNPRRPLSS